MKKLFVILCLASCFRGFAMKNVAVAKFKSVGLSDNETAGVTELFASLLANHDRITVVDKTKVDYVLEKMSFNDSDLSNKSKLVVLGKSVQASFVVTGSAIKLGDSLSLTATAFAVNFGINKSFSETSCGGLNDIFDAMKTLASEIAEGLSWKIGDVGPGGGTVFWVLENMAYECSEPIERGTWEKADEACRAYKGGGYSDWHLPSVDELSGIYNFDKPWSILTDYLNIDHWEKGFWSSDAGTTGMGKKDGDYHVSGKQNEHNKKYYNESYRNDWLFWFRAVRGFAIDK